MGEIIGSRSLSYDISSLEPTTGSQRLRLAGARRPGRPKQTLCPAIGGPGLGQRECFYYKLVCGVASLDTQCIVSNFESERYISRVGRASTVGTSYRPPYHGSDGTNTQARIGKEQDYNTKKHITRSDMERVTIWNDVTASA